MNLAAPGDLPVIYRSVDLVDMEIVIRINIIVDLSEVGRFSGLRRSGNWLAYFSESENVIITSELVMCTLAQNVVKWSIS